MSQSAILRTFTVLYLIRDFVTAQDTAIPRWGQAAALVDNTLFVHGGRTEQFNSWAYTSAPVSNDLFSLSLSSSFNTSSPPWNYLSGCSNCSSQQGPAVVWHTLSAFNTSTLLLFGGQLGPNSSIPVPEEADSAALLNVGDTSDPGWMLEGQGWGSEPLRRMFHSASSSSGKIWLVGGEKTDGSNTALSDHYVFDPTVPSFTQLPSTNGPPDITGHQSVVLSNGWLLVLGGFSQSENSLVPFTTIWAMDTTSSSLGWATLSVSDANVPPPRRGFAAALMDDGKIVIHGGADAALQTTYDDGWVLDTTQNPMAWSSVSALSQLGPRRDHFAVAQGSQVIFGFGYETNGPAPADLLVFDFSTNAFASSFAPPSSATGSPSNTIPGPSPTGSSGASPPSSGSGSGTGSGSGQDPPGTGGDSQSDAGGGYPQPTSPGGGNGNGSNGTGGPGSMDPAGGTSRHDDAAAIALGTVFGVLGVLVGATAAAWYVRHQRARASFHVLDGTDTDDAAGPGARLGASIPVAGAQEKRLPPALVNVKNRLGGLVPGRARPQQQRRRRDMLADEDTREFGLPAWYVARREASSGQSSWSSGGTLKRPTFGEVMQGSLASLKSIGGAMFGYSAVARGPRSREGSAGSAGWWEKHPPYEPFAGDVGLVSSHSASYHASRPRGGREPSYATVRSGPYVDPFDDYEIESFKLPGEDSEEDDYSDDELAELGLPSLKDPPPRPYGFLDASAGRVDVNQLSPISEFLSASTLSNLLPSSDSSHATPPLPASSHSSQEASRSPRPRPSSIIDANPPPSEPMRRSNSWWARFAKTPLLERRTSVQRPLEFRDPNPPPRLVPIAESAHSPSQSQSPPDSPEARRAREMYAGGHHRRSTTSLQTAQTADSAVIERMGCTLDVVQQDSLSSHASAPSTGSACDDAPPGALAPDTAELVQSPTRMTPAEGARLPPPPAYERTSPPRRPASSGRVAARVQDLERRMSQAQQGDSPSPPLPPPARARRPRAASTYGLAPKSPLFVANPDHRHHSSSSSS
ncbi:hypothetical protein CERSUDRAFT_159368 [Gelatoporia subvermispora B]|uniref:Galactose oxidase n=1 Tax=Ceriporiopsis subvermispora (strain B) TaxID=914234 RepID=M2QPB1_CERS8|nr:hypothetical protein CERSUDRAFT_159368 [Gelatoporia subvermispora B]